MKKPKLIYLQWADATSPLENEWETADDARQWAKEDSYWIDHVGWLLEETKEYILTASMQSTTHTGEDIIQYSHS